MKEQKTNSQHTKADIISALMALVHYQYKATQSESADTWAIKGNDVMTSLIYKHYETARS